MLDDGLVCWWERMPTAEMGCGTCDPKEAVFFFSLLTATRASGMEEK